MNIEYVCHACLLIDTGDVKIATDPWFAGPAYCGQWHVFPQPLNVDILQEADVILISHGHEDHLHAPSLAQLPHKATVFFPYLWYGGTKAYIDSLGFRHVIEAMPNRTYRLTSNTSIEYLANDLDSIIVIKANDKIIINLNDALHSSTGNVIDLYIDILRKKYRKIDVVFCGFGGASYYPNVFHIPEKDNVEIGKMREWVFIHNFCKIISGLQPHIAIPFAADFVLLSPWQKWINEVRFPRQKIKNYYHRICDKDDKEAVEIYDMYSSDRLESDQIVCRSPYRQYMTNNKWDELLAEQYPEEISSLKVDAYLESNEAESLQAAIEKNINERARALEETTLARLKFCIEVLDVSKSNLYHVAFEGKHPRVWRANAPVQDSILTLKTTSTVLYTSFESDWGGDAICIGYGCDITIHDRSIIQTGLHMACINLLTRYPKFTGHLKTTPVRALRAFSGNPGLRRVAADRIFKRHTPDIVSGNHWLLKSPAQIGHDFHFPPSTLTVI